MNITRRELLSILGAAVAAPVVVTLGSPPRFVGVDLGTERAAFAMMHVEPDGSLVIDAAATAPRDLAPEALARMLAERGFAVA